MALERPVAPAARSCRSRSSTRPAPARARCQAVLVPSHPPPITTTSADSAISPSVCAVSTAYRATPRDQPRPVDAGDGGRAEGARAAVLGRVPGLTLLAVQEQGGAGDPGPQEIDVPAAH